MKTILLKFVVAAAGLCGLAAVLLCGLALGTQSMAPGTAMPAFLSSAALAGFDPLSALSLLLLTLGVLLARFRKIRVAGRLLSILGSLGGALQIADVIAGTGIAGQMAALLRMPSAELASAAATASAGQTASLTASGSLATAAAIACFGLASLLLLFRRYAAGQAVAALGLLPCLTSGLGYLLGTDVIFGHLPVPVLAATALCGAALLGSIGHRGAIRVFLSRTISGSFGRKQMLIATLAPVGFALLYAHLLPAGAPPLAVAETVASVVVVAWITMGGTALVGRHLDIRRHRAEAELRNMARHDALTGLLNRRSMNSALPQRFARARETGRPISLLMCDLDFFKLLNDEHGHAIGDDVLRRTAERISAAVRDSDLVFRYGGEEIAVLLDCGSADAQRVAEKIRESVKSPGRRTGDTELPTATISIGAATCAATSTATLGQLMAAADECLYAAKDAGRDCVRHMEMA